MLEIGDYVEYKYGIKTIIGYILGFHSDGEHVLIQITKGGNFGHSGISPQWYGRDRKTPIPHTEGSNRFWVPEDKLVLRESRNFYEIY